MLIYGINILVSYSFNCHITFSFFSCIIFQTFDVTSETSIDCWFLLSPLSQFILPDRYINLFSTE
uniref:Uncharacterized protein n=1 Tax=Rhizophora mucronata TaxID=61149 RepID=A0A2P2QAL7_RHIMU